MANGSNQSPRMRLCPRMLREPGKPMRVGDSLCMENQCPHFSEVVNIYYDVDDGFISREGVRRIGQSYGSLPDCYQANKER